MAHADGAIAANTEFYKVFPGYGLWKGKVQAENDDGSFQVEYTDESGYCSGDKIKKAELVKLLITMGPNGKLAKPKTDLAARLNVYGPIRGKRKAAENRVAGGPAPGSSSSRGNEKAAAPLPAEANDIE